MKLLIVEDNQEFADYLRRGLTYEGYRIQLASTAEAGLRAVRRHRPDLVILDVMLPGMDGMTACRSLRDADYRGPVLMLTARNTIDDRVSGLNAGADDYLGKPFDFAELLARLRALLRRQEASTVQTFADLVLDSGLREARRGERQIKLSRTEYDLLAFFLEYPEQVLEREEVIARIWGPGQGVSAHVLTVYISRLRDKLGEPPLIQTVHGVGYILKKEA